MGQGRKLRRQKAPGHKNVRQSDQKGLGFLPGECISGFRKGGTFTKGRGQQERGGCCPG